jgi:hypothetical protein
MQLVLLHALPLDGTMWANEMQLLPTAPVLSNPSVKRNRIGEKSAKSHREEQGITIRRPYAARQIH